MDIVENSYFLSRPATILWNLFLAIIEGDVNITLQNLNESDEIIFKNFNFGKDIQRVSVGCAFRSTRMRRLSVVPIEGKNKSYCYA